MRCDIISFSVPVDGRFNIAGNVPGRTCVQCNTHSMVDFAPYAYEGMLCPIGRIEQAVEDGLKKIAEAKATP
jgi:hypothetical protein